MIGRVLCVCEGNYCRSQIAGVLLVREAARLGYDLEVRTAGISSWGVGRNPAPAVKKVVEELGGFIQPFEPHLVTPDEMRWADITLVMEASQGFYLSREFANYPTTVAMISRLVGGEFDIPNPHHLDNEQVEKVTRLLQRIVIDGYAELREWLRLSHLGKLRIEGEEKWMISA